MLLFSTVNDIQLRFSTPIMVRKWPEAYKYNDELRSIILQKQRSTDGVHLSNKGGWQSDDDLFRWGDKSIAALSQWVANCIYNIYYTYYREEFFESIQSEKIKFQLNHNGWANVNKKGDWNSTHNHPNSHWSGCYYVQAPNKSGVISFFDPRPHINMLDSGYPMLDIFRQAPQDIEPEDGLTVIFPSWLQHQVTTHESDNERISIAFNTKIHTSKL